MCLNSNYLELQDCVTNCGYCPECYLKRRNSWRVRLHYETMDTPAVYALTLTYDPSTRPDYINYADVQAFYKNLRHKIDVPIKHFTSCEYGAVKGHPHYHSLVMQKDGIPFLLQLKLKERRLNGFDLYSSKTVSASWGKGLCWVQLINGSDSYVKYISKYFLKEQFDPHNYKRFFSDDESSEAETRAFIRRIRPQQKGSLSLGYKSWLKRLTEYINDGYCVYIDGRQMQVPISWIKKICAPLFSSRWLSKYCPEISAENLDHYKRLATIDSLSRVAAPSSRSDLVTNSLNYARVLHHYNTAQAPLDPRAPLLFANYLELISDFDPKLVAFEASNRTHYSDSAKDKIDSLSATLDV